MRDVAKAYQTSPYENSKPEKKPELYQKGKGLGKDVSAPTYWGAGNQRNNGVSNYTNQILCHIHEGTLDVVVNITSTVNENELSRIS